MLYLRDELPIYYIVTSLSIRFLVVLLFVESFDLAYFTYDYTRGLSPGDYINVLLAEYEQRTQTLCLVHHFEQNVLNVLIFFNWL